MYQGCVRPYEFKSEQEKVSLVSLNSDSLLEESEK